MKQILSSLKNVARRSAGHPAHVPHLIGINEAVNFELNAIFIAVPKTGTTSIRDQMREDRQFAIPSPHLNLREVRIALNYHFMRQGLEQNFAFPTDLEAMQTTDQTQLKAAAFYDAAFKFGSVRNPWARVASLYARREGVPTADKMTFAVFCDQLASASDTCRRPSLHMNQLDWLTDETGAIGVDYVMKLEERDAGLAAIRDQTNGRLVLDNVTANANPGSKSVRYQDLYDDQTRQIVAALFEKDIDTFKYAF